MPITEAHIRDAALMMRVLPCAAQEDRFALKGGTAINFFIRDYMPRLSFDLDLMYLPVQTRPEALSGIDESMKGIEARIRAAIPASRIRRMAAEGAVMRLHIEDADGTWMKIELSPVQRGVVGEPSRRTANEHVAELFGDAEIQVVSFQDAYAGKLVAALDRQLPRDLFDVGHLLRNEGLTDELREAFIVYILGHNRPMGEVLEGRSKEFVPRLVAGLVQSTDEDISVENLAETRQELIDGLIGSMPDRHREMLVSFERGEPDWSLLSVPHAKELPAIKWRQVNLATRNEQQRAALVASLEASLERRSN